MNIAYKGNFLHEGLRDNGHKVFPINPANGETLPDVIKTLQEPVDLVVWELFGASANISALTPCDPPIVAHCIDTPLNSFWMKPFLKNFDHVFVDQPQCATELTDSGIRASWLPLPAQKSWFQPKREKKHELTFIGRTNSMRAKRTNLLRLIQTRFNIHIMSGLDLQATQRAFAESRIILNENFFPGLTMRVLQGLSAGAIVFTEQSPYGDSFGLEDGRDLICYKPENVLERLSDLMENYESYADIGVQGQAKCRDLYSCELVAADLVSRISAEGRQKREIEEEAWICNRTVSELLFAQRFGGDFSAPMKRLRDISESSTPQAAEAHALIGDIQARFKGGQASMAHYLRALEIDPAHMAALKMALLQIRQNDVDAALKTITAWTRHAPDRYQGNISRALGSGKSRDQSLLSVIGEIFLSFGRRWDMGFQKDFSDPVPDTAFEVARMAWNLHPSSWALDMMARCLEPDHLQGELLPYMLDGIRQGVLTDEQILKTANTAFSYYDRETASTILNAMNRS